MMRYRIHRSLVFWFGLAGLVFLVWAWGISMKRWTQVSYSSGKSYTNLWLAQARIGLLTDMAASRKSFAPDWSFGSFDLTEADWTGRTDTHFPGWESPTNHHAPGVRVRQWIIPHWMVVASYALVWAGVLGWRWRRAGR